MVPRDRLIIAIGLKYTSRRVISFVSIEAVGSTKNLCPFLNNVFI